MHGSILAGRVLVWGARSLSHTHMQTHTHMHIFLNEELSKN